MSHTLCPNCRRAPTRRNDRCHPCSLYLRRTNRERPVELIERHVRRSYEKPGP